MYRPLRRFRGVIVIGLTWGVVWSAIGALISIVAGILDPETIEPGEDPVRVGTILGMIGLASGAAFAVVLAVAEAGRKVLDLGTGRAALWGVLATALVPLVTAKPDQVLTLCPIGAALAAASVALARSAARSGPGRATILREGLSALVLAPLRDVLDGPRGAAA